MLFPNVLCGNCKEQAVLLKVDPPIDGKDVKCSKCGQLSNNYVLNKNSQVVVISYDDLLAIAKKNKQ